ncbi:MAG: hypothetical protein A2173_04620 [Planctomycetes bacterium RBG_13_44_8b]|nr:MAG: hypothetical protein A2173_04620 [Planctomycetes bacterium RBG_13_44_8b]
MKKLFLLLLVFSLNGCMTPGHKQFYEQDSLTKYKQFYEQIAPTKYTETQKVMIFEYANVNLRGVYDLLFNDFLIIGKSRFNGSYEDPKRSIGYAQSIGADVFITTAQFRETRTSFINLNTPTISTTAISGYIGSGPFYGTATTYGTTTITVPIRVDRYDQDGLYLKNVNNIVPLWERKLSDYKETEENELSGVWYNENYEINIYQSGKQMVAFLNSEPKDRAMWKINEFKMIFDQESGIGVYLMENKTPMPAIIMLNKFGHLEVDLFTQNLTSSFARK